MNQRELQQGPELMLARARVYMHEGVCVAPCKRFSKPFCLTGA